MIYDEPTGVGDPAVATLDDGSELCFPREARTQDLLIPVFRAGQLVYQFPSVHEARRRAMEQSSQLRGTLGQLPPAARYPVGIETHLHALKQRMIDALGEIRR